jgi:hypothetical protein
MRQKPLWRRLNLPQKIFKINIARPRRERQSIWVSRESLGVRPESPVLFKMKIPYDSRVAIRTALQLRLEDLENRIQKAEQNKDKINLEFWMEKHQALVSAIQDLQEVL